MTIRERNTTAAAQADLKVYVRSRLERQCPLWATASEQERRALVEDAYCVVSVDGMSWGEYLEDCSFFETARDYLEESWDLEKDGTWRPLFTVRGYTPQAVRP